MHTLVVLSCDGGLRITLEDQGEPVDQSRWEAHLVCAVWWLRATGGGTMVVPHTPGSLT